MLGIIKNFFPRSSNRFPDLFKDTSLDKEILDKGYVVRDFLEQDDVLRLYNGFNTIHEKLSDKPGKFWPSGRSGDPEIRNMARQFTSEVLDGRFTKFFDTTCVTLMGGTYLYKPPTNESHLYPHQDASISDEVQFLSVYAWIPLCDVDENNGCMMILPGSHRIRNYFRSLNVPWIFEGMEEEMLKVMIPVRMKAGQVLFFHSAMIHGSPVNKSTQPRVAVNYFIKPADAKFVHPYIDASSTEKKIELYEITPDFYYCEDFMQRPSSNYPYLGVASRIDTATLKKELHQLCKKLPTQ